MRAASIALGLGGAALTALVLSLSKKAEAAGPIALPPPAPGEMPPALKVGDEVAVPISELPGLPGVPANTGGAVVTVDSLDPARGAFQGRVVAFIGPGGTSDLTTPIGPVALRASAIATRLQAPTDRIGRFAIIGDIVEIPAASSISPALDRANRAAVARAFPGAFQSDADGIAALRVRVTSSTADAQGRIFFAGPIRGLDIAGPGRSAGVNLGANAPDPTDPALQSGVFPRSAIRSVVRNGVKIA